METSILGFFLLSDELDSFFFPSVTLGFPIFSFTSIFGSKTAATLTPLFFSLSEELFSFFFPMANAGFGKLPLISIFGSSFSNAKFFCLSSDDEDSFFFPIFIGDFSERSSLGSLFFCFLLSEELVSLFMPSFTEGFSIVPLGSISKGFTDRSFFCFLLSEELFFFFPTTTAGFSGLIFRFASGICPIKSIFISLLSDELSFFFPTTIPGFSEFSFRSSFDFGLENSNSRSLLSEELDSFFVPNLIEGFSIFPFSVLGLKAKFPGSIDKPIFLLSLSDELDWLFSIFVTGFSMFSLIPLSERFPTFLSFFLLSELDFLFFPKTTAGLKTSSAPVNFKLPLSFFSISGLLRSTTNSFLFFLNFPVFSSLEDEFLSKFFFPSIGTTPDSSPGLIFLFSSLESLSFFFLPMTTFGWSMPNFLDFSPSAFSIISALTSTLSLSFSSVVFSI